MKATAILLTIVLCSFFAAAQPSVQKKTLITIEEGEIPYFNESNIGLSCGAGGFCVLVQNPDSKYYVYENGIKKGPFEDASSAMKVCYTEEDYDQNYMNITTYDEIDASAYVSSDGEFMSIKFNNKTYGPYQLVSAFSLSPDKKHFMAAGRNSSGFVFISDQLGEQPSPIEFKAFHWSPDNSSGFGLFLSGYDVTTIMNTDMSSMTDEQKMELLTKMQQEIDNTKEELFVYFNNGTKFGPFPKGNEGSSNPAFSKTAPGHWIMVNNYKLYIDGVVVKDFSGGDYINAQDVWLSPDGKQFAIKYYDKLVFSDGTSYDYPIMVNNCANTIGRLDWICFENETTIVHYSRMW